MDAHKIDIHYSDVVLVVMAFQITSLTTVYLPFIQAQIKENIKTPSHWPLCVQRASNTENVSIWWRHYSNLREYGRHGQKQRRRIFVFFF